MKYLLYILPIILLGSCSVQQMANYHCKRCPTSDSTFTKEVDSSNSKVDTTWKTFYNPADSLKLADNLSAYMDSLGKCRVKDSQGETESGKIKVKYVIRNDSIFIDCNTKPYEIKIAELTKTINHYHSLYEYHRKTATIKEKTRPSWFSYWQTWACIVAVILRITFFILKKTGVFPIQIKRSG